MGIVASLTPTASTDGSRCHHRQLHAGWAHGSEWTATGNHPAPQVNGSLDLNDFAYGKDDDENDSGDEDVIDGDDDDIGNSAYFHDHDDDGVQDDYEIVSRQRLG